MDALNKKLFDEGRKNFIILDNFSGHNTNEFSNTKLLFLPPSTTSLLQILDQKIIHSFKSKTLINNFISAKLCKDELDLREVYFMLDMKNILFRIKESYDEIDFKT